MISDAGHESNQASQETVSNDSSNSNSNLKEFKSIAPIQRGRARSISVSEGSPSPGSIQDNIPKNAVSSWNSNGIEVNGSGIHRGPESNNGDIKVYGFEGPAKGHRVSLSVPGILSPQPISARVGRHRRNASVSPPGFPVISEGDISGFETIKTESTSSKAIPMPIKLPPPKSTQTGLSPTSQSSKHPSPTALSTSPNSQQHHLHIFQSHHANSHAALLYGVRSHTLPHSPTHIDSNRQEEILDSSNTWNQASRSPTGTISPASPPFGPTPTSNYHPPSPLALEFHRESSEEVQHLSEGGLEDRRFEPDERMPGAFEESPKSPALPPVFLETPTNQGRRRAGSFTRSEEADSPSSLYLAEENVSPFGQCDIRDGPFVPTSPASPPLFPTPLPIISSTVTTRPRSRSFTSDRNFSPILLNDPSMNVSPPPIPLISPPSPAFEEFSPTMELLSTNSSSTEELGIFPPPPPSPHRNSIALPPPAPAVAILPPHLGGPALPRVGGRTARAMASNLALSQKLSSGNGVVGMEHLPKKHSPLAEAVVRDMKGRADFEEEKGLEEERGSVEDELLEAESCLMNLIPATTNPSLTTTTNRESYSPTAATNHLVSPYGSPDAVQLEAYLTLHSELTLALSPRRGEVEILAVPKSGWDEDEGDDLVLESSTEHEMEMEAEKESEVIEEASGLLLSSTELSHFESSEERKELNNLMESFGESNQNFIGNGNSNFGFMELDSPSVGFTATSTTMNREIVSVGMVRSTEVADVSIEEEKLSPLERIFICAKSEHSEERARVSHNLGEWLLQVDICDAVEYVLPLLPELATDAEDIVKEVLSPQLDRIMWHFFSQCPLLEINSTNQESSPFPSPSLHNHLDPHSHSHHTLPPSINSSHPSLPKPFSTKEFAPVPAISSTTFTSLLGALLTDQSSLVAKSTQASLVRFLCRLKGKPILLNDGNRAIPTESFEAEPRLAGIGGHEHLPYTISIEAKKILEDEFVTGIVLGLARLDEDLELSMEGLDQSTSAYLPPPAMEHTEIVLSPEEENFDDGSVGDSWLLSATEEVDSNKIIDDWGPYSSPTQESKPINFTNLPTTSFDLVQSAFSPDLHGDEESAIGKMVSMGLIGAIALAECLEVEILVEQILPEVERMKGEGMFYVRKEAVQALGSLARSLPLDCFESVVLPLHAAFARDNLWHVRRAACLALPAICKRLPYTLLRKQVVENIQYFSTDSSRNVRSGALEVCGELIYLFKDDPEGVPIEVINFFLGKEITQNGTGPVGLDFGVQNALDNPLDTQFTPLANALDSPPTTSTFFDGPPSWLPTANLSSSTLPRDPDRPVMCAFNIPAVVLTLGRENWKILELFYEELSLDKTDKVRQSLASSLHEISNIIGQENCDNCLLVPFNNFLGDYEFIQLAVLEHVVSIVSNFSINTGRMALGMIEAVWSDIRNWRMREKLSRDLCEFGKRFILFEGEELLRLMAVAFKDPVASVRNSAVYSVPITFDATKSDPAARAKLFAFLNIFSEDSAYRNRAIYTATVMAFVQHGISREIFEGYFLNTLIRLAGDKVVSIRISVARIIETVCGFAHLYHDLQSRKPIFEILSLLAHSHDRDVKLPVLHFYIDSFAASRLPSHPPPPPVDEEMTEVVLNDFSKGEIIPLEEEDVEMGEEGVLLESPSPVLWSKELDVEGFVEVKGF